MTKKNYCRSSRNYPELVEDHKVSSPALLVFGDVVSLHPAFARIRDFYHVLAEG
ncbi:hypothetical protein [Pedobacter sp. NJ-S-72]